ncbi:tRNA nucleotidyltransferase/poly(A) polymerase [Candidatus Omnitrophus magneticus]|uniref:tRNA nucleotidyltransferase/poly(A) polymerase n=1 Tax=Candidatus Omnitrophus magneticus TaxID=1609969 RepID=A0A0F0CTL8_9BACT|nr:tRNA nucleotidyltransferase/poly(A) polymerase [Candidatus Omnitrophus magneticus]
MDLIISHKDADFDALSSIITVKKLYPNAKLLLPGSQEKSVRNFLSLFKDEIPLENEKIFPFDKVQRLIIVDNRHKNRLGKAGELTLKKNITIHIYDHHPPSQNDITGDKDVFKETGATVTLLLEILQKKNKFNFTPWEATLMLLGIYEETGSLSYRNTTKLDIDMVSKLIEKGAQLNTASLYLNRELDNTELKALINLMESIEVINMHGIRIAFAGISNEDFAGETGAVMHKLEDVENYPVIFAMFQHKDNIKVLARSRNEFIDVNKLLSPFGGGGHASASSARFHNKTFADVKNELLLGIEKFFKPDALVKDIMTPCLMTIFQDEKINDVLTIFENNGLNGALVTDETGALKGVITKSDLKKAIYRNMGHSRIKGYMSINPVTISPNAPVYELEKIMNETGKGYIPVMDGEKIKGVAARIDVLKNIHKNLFDPKHNSTPKFKNVSKRMTKILPQHFIKLIREIGIEGDSLGVNIFLVGGCVRDIMMGVKNYDFDIVVEGSAIHLAEVLSEKFQSALVVHKNFGTASLVMKKPPYLEKNSFSQEKFKIDIATSRRETYASPGALPRVEASSLRYDLYRRDFTINAMAIKINSEDFGFFIDFFGGIKDLQNKTVRVLHDKSFIDDPTRIFRAARFSERFGFKIDKHTEYLIQHAVKEDMFTRVDNQRIRDELILMLSEKVPFRAVYRMKKLDELKFIHHSLKIGRSTKKSFLAVHRIISWYKKTAQCTTSPLKEWLIYFLILIDTLTKKETEEIIKKFVFPGDINHAIHFNAENYILIKRKLSSNRPISPSKIYEILEKADSEVIISVIAKLPKNSPAINRAKKFMKFYRFIRLEITGDDIKKEGITPGPIFRSIFKKILAEKLDGKITNKLDEITLMKKLIANTRG